MSEIIEQLRMRGSAAAGAEVVLRRYQAGAEMVLPDTVDHDAGRERIARVREPLGQLQPTTAGARRQRVAAEDREESPRHQIARSFRIAALVQPGVVWLSVHHAIGHRRGR